MIKAATQNSLLTNSRSILTILDQFKKDLRALREKLIEIQKDLFILAADAYQARRLCAKSRYIRPFVNPLRGLL